MFLSFEGIDGSGKTTQAHRLADHLERQGRRVLRVREPGGTPLGEQIRSWLLDPTQHIVPRAELLLFSAARAQLVDEVIRPALAAGTVVIADRFFDSTTAYQGGGRRVLPVEEARAFHAMVTGGLVPDQTVVVDVDVETARARRAMGADDRMEGEGEAFQQRVRLAYLDLARREPGRVVVVDGTVPPNDVERAIVSALGVEG